jgi:hypothetical protein
MLPPTLKILRKFGRLPLTGRDFIGLCDANDIEFVISKDAKRGFYYFSDGRHYIVVPSSASAEKRQETAWHEFSHFLQNFYARSTAAAFCGVKATAPGERFAKIFARIATKPEWYGVTGPMDFIKMIMRTRL